MACCPRVRKARVRVGMSIAQAHDMSIAAGLGGVVIERHDPYLDQIAMDQVAWWMQQTVSPLVAIESLDDRPWAGHPRHQPESLICDISGVSHLFGGEAGTMTMVTELLSSLGLAGRLAIADSLGAAWAVAHYQTARSHAAEDRCFIVPPGHDRAAIEPLSVESLRVAPETIETLGRLGVETVGHLLRLPRSGLAPRLGIGLVRRIEQALGEVEEPVASFRAEAEHSETLPLEYPTADQPILADRIGRLTTKVRAGLATRQRGALRMACRLDLSAHPPLTIDIGLFAPSIDAKHLSGLIINRLEQTRLRSSVRQVTVSVTLTGPLRTVQTSLFESSNLESPDSSPLSGSSISRLIDSLSGRLGRNAVVDVKLSGDPLPENAFYVSPLAGNQTTYGRTQRSLDSRFFSKTFTPSSSDAIRRPLWLLSTPLVLSTAFGDQPFVQSTTDSTLPDRLRIHGETHTIVRFWGAERIETGWWKGPSINRDYFRIETDRNQWLWVYRGRLARTAGQATGPTFQWMLHGHFA